MNRFDNAFSYNRTWEEIEEMLVGAEKKYNYHHAEYSISTSKEDKLYHARNYKALQGVIKTLKWVLGDRTIQHPLN